MNSNHVVATSAPNPEQEPLVAALLRHATVQADAEPAHSICVHCGRRVDGTSKRRYCGRQCASRALLIRRRQARSRMSQILRR